MAHIEYQGKHVEIAEDWRVDELIEAENALNLDMEGAKGGTKMALVIYISIRRMDKNTPSGVLADAAMRVNMSELKNEETDAVPPADAAGNGRSSETDEQLTSGLHPSGHSA